MELDNIVNKFCLRFMTLTHSTPVDLLNTSSRNSSSKKGLKSWQSWQNRLFKITYKKTSIKDVFLNWANFAPHALLTLVPSSVYALNLKALIKVSKVSWTTQLSYAKLICFKVNCSKNELILHSDLECLVTFVNSKMIKFQIFNFFLL